jgi:hypothetical protein
VSWAESIIFEAGWRRYRRAVGRGRNEVDFDVKVRDDRLDRYLTLVVRVPTELGQRIVEAVTTVAEKEPGHYVYPSADLHLTVVDCSVFLGPGDLSYALSELSGSVGAVLARMPTAQVNLRGLNLLPASVYAQAWDPDGGLRRMRRQLRARFASRTMLRDRVSFVNALRFAGPTSALLAGRVAKARGTDFGSFVADSVELVLSDRTLSAPETTHVASYSLGADA